VALTDIREQIAAILAAVDGAGVVHQYQRATAGDWGKFLNLFQDADGKINTCMISRTDTAQQKVTMGEKELAHIFTLRFYYGLRDEQATELTFQEMLENVREAFNESETLNDTCLTTIPDWGPMNGVAGLQIGGVSIRFFGNVLCHYAECRLCALDREED